MCIYFVDFFIINLLSLSYRILEMNFMIFIEMQNYFYKLFILWIIYFLWLGMIS